MEIGKEHGRGHLRVDFEVKFTDSEGPQQFHDAIDELTTLWGVRLNEIMIEEENIRPDGKGTAHDTGALNDGTVVLDDQWDHVIVGTNIEYAPKLARGTPEPSTDYDDILRWAQRKQLPPNMKKGYRKKSRAQARFARNVFNKVTTEGPIPNPFDVRTVNRFEHEWQDYISEVYL